MDDSDRRTWHVADAFVDRSSIDWQALSALARSESERRIFEHLRFLEVIRGDLTPRDPLRQPRTWHTRAARLVLLVSALQFTLCVGLASVALAQGSLETIRPVQTVVALAFGLACVVLVMAIRSDARGLFLLAAFATAAGAFGRSAVGMLIGPGSPVTALVLGIVPESFTPACLWQFALDFPHTRRFDPFDRIARRASMVVWIASSVLFSANAGAFALASGPLSLLLRNDQANVFWHMFAAGMGSSLCVLAVRSLRAPKQERKRVLHLGTAIAAGGTPLVVSGIVWACLPLTARWAGTVSLDPFWLDSFVVLSLVATPVLSAIAVIADRPFERQGRFARTMNEALARLIDAGDWRRIRRSRGYEDHLASSLEGIRLARGNRDLLDVLERSLRIGLRVELVRHFISEAADSPATSDRRAVRLSDTLLAALLRETKEPIDLTAAGGVRDLLPEPDREWAIANHAALVAGITLREGVLVAVLVIGRRDDGLPFERHDRWLVRTLMAAAGTAWQRHESGSDLEASGLCGELAFECAECGTVSESRNLPCDCRKPAILAALPRYLDQQFLVERRLGAGGMGIVYLARDTRLERVVALKTLAGLSPGAAARLEAEARAMAGLAHPSLATIHGLASWHGTPVLIVEYLSGGPLSARLAAGPLGAEEVVALGLTLTGALSYMHARGVLHRDLKPSNIAFTETGAAKLLDFGLATMAVAQGKPASAGTTAYLPPEAFTGAAPVSIAFDLWAAAVVLLEAICGRHPFAAGHMASARGRWRAVDVEAALSTAHGSSPALARVLGRALRLEPAGRFQSSAALHNALAAIASGRP